MRKCIQLTGTLMAFLVLHQFALSQVSETEFPFSISDSKELSASKQNFYFIPGGGYYGRHAPNTFTVAMCSYLHGLLGADFGIVSEPVSHLSLANVGWALWHGQEPIRKQGKNRKVRLAFNRIVSDSIPKPDQITIISSSFGTVLASQLARELARFYGSQPVQPQINLFLGASMLCKESQLYQELNKLQQEGLITCMVYDELQDAGDNVTGLCGKTRLQAFSNAFRITFVMGGNYLAQPSILNNHPYKGHLHLQRAQSAEKGKDFVKAILIDYELAGPKTRDIATEVLKQGE